MAQCALKRKIKAQNTAYLLNNIPKHQKRANAPKAP
jgi:hypothetical protein